MLDRRPDSQHQLIERLWTLKLFAPGGLLDGKLCLLDAADVEFPIAVNLFDMQLERAARQSLLDRERVLNSASKCTTSSSARSCSRK